MNLKINLKRCLALCIAFCIVISLFLIPAAETKAAETKSSATSSESSETGSTADSGDSAAAVEWPSGPSINSPCACVMEVNTGTILYEKNDHEVHYPASITKILTTLLALENDELDETVTFGKTAVYENEGDTSHIARDLGEEMSVEDTLYAVMLESANECAYQIAEYTGEKIGDGIDSFIDLMNARAQELGCTDTHFNNPNGLPDTEHYTTAYDFCLISCEAYRNEEFRTITGTKKHTIPPTNKHSDPTYLNNHHKLLHYYRTGDYVNEYCTGGKTGYTKVARNTLVTYAEKDGMAICVVIMYAEGQNHFIDTNTLINYCFSNYQKYDITDSDASQTENAKDYGLLNNNRGFVTMDSDSYVILPKNASFADVEMEETTETSDDALAVVSYSYDGHQIGTAKIVTNTSALAGSSIFDQGNSGVSDTESSSAGTTTVNSQGQKVMKVTPIAAMAIIIIFLLIILVIILVIRLVVTLRAEKQARENANRRNRNRVHTQKASNNVRSERLKEAEEAEKAEKAETAEEEAEEEAEEAEEPEKAEKSARMSKLTTLLFGDPDEEDFLDDDLDDDLDDEPVKQKKRAPKAKDHAEKSENTRSQTKKDPDAKKHPKKDEGTKIYLIKKSADEGFLDDDLDDSDDGWGETNDDWDIEIPVAKAKTKTVSDHTLTKVKPAAKAKPVIRTKAEPAAEQETEPETESKTERKAISKPKWTAAAKTDSGKKYDWRTDPKRQERMMKARQQREQQRWKENTQKLQTSGWDEPDDLEQTLADLDEILKKNKDDQ